jgi:hypothetical protein
VTTRRSEKERLVDHKAGWRCLFIWSEPSDNR